MSDQRDDLLIRRETPKDEAIRRGNPWLVRGAAIAGAAAIAVVRFGMGRASAHHSLGTQSFDGPHGDLGHGYAATSFGQRALAPMEEETPTPKVTRTATPKVTRD